MLLIAGLPADKCQQDILCFFAEQCCDNPAGYHVDKTVTASARPIMTRQDDVYKKKTATHMMEGGGADVVQVTQQCEQTALQLVVPHLQQQHTIYRVQI